MINDGRPFRMVAPLVLASGSPRRRRLLESVGLSFEVMVSGVEETLNNGAPRDLVAKWAARKAEAVADARPDCWVLGSDTVVAHGGRNLGKPVDAAEAGEMLRSLSGRTHEVLSGVCLINREAGVRRVAVFATRVTFREVTAAEIEAYVATGEPLDKAGAYGIQGMGAFLVRSVEGSYTNVVGLPLCETLEWLLEYGVIEPVGG